MKTKDVRYIVAHKQGRKWVDTWWTGKGEEPTPPLVTKRLALRALRDATEAYPESKYRIEARLV